MHGIWAKQALTATGWKRDVRVTINADGRIGTVEPDIPADRLDSGDHATGVLLPAPSNVHSHAFQRAFAGLTERRGNDPSDNFWTWRQLMYRFLQKLSPDDVEAITAFVQMAMLEAGYAAVGEFHYVHHQPDGSPYDRLGEISEHIVAAAATTGIGLTLLPVLYQHHGCDGRPLSEGQVRFGNDPERFARLHQQAGQALSQLDADANLGVAPHSLRAVTPDALKFAQSLANGDPIHIHVAEQVAEVEEVTAAWGARPVEWLLAHQEVGANWCLIHCTQMMPWETELLARSGAVAGLCPITESNLGDGIFDGVRYFAAGGRIGIGSDSNIRIALSEELRTLEYSQRLRDRTRAALATQEESAGRRLFAAACKGGAQALGRNAGEIAAGRLADLVALDDSAVDLVGRTGDVLLDSFVFAADDRLVWDVWSAGRHVVSGGTHFARDAVSERYAAVMKSLGDVL